MAMFFGLLALAFTILKPFLVPLGWSLVLVISTWPLLKGLEFGCLIDPAFALP